MQKQLVKRLLAAAVLLLTIPIAVVVLLKGTRAAAPVAAPVTTNPPRCISRFLKVLMIISSARELTTGIPIILLNPAVKLKPATQKSLTAMS